MQPLRYSNQYPIQVGPGIVHPNSQSVSVSLFSIHVWCPKGFSSVCIKLPKKNNNLCLHKCINYDIFVGFWSGSWNWLLSRLHAWNLNKVIFNGSLLLPLLCYLCLSIAKCTIQCFWYEMILLIQLSALIVSNAFDMKWCY